MKQSISTVLVSGLAGIVFFWLLFPVPRSQDKIDLVIRPVNELVCSTGNFSNQNSLHVYGENIRGGQALISALCSSGEIQKNYSTVSYAWAYNEVDLKNSVRELNWDLAFGRRHIFGGTEKIPSGYTAIAEYDVYKAYLVSNNIIVPRQLNLLKLGLLSNAESSSGHKVPKAYIRSLRLNPDELSIRYYPNHGSLRKALAAREVDVIGSYWNDSDRENYPDFHALEIQDGLAGSQWFVQSEYFNSDTTCVFTTVLQSLATITEDRYFQNINLLRNCSK